MHILFSTIFLFREDARNVFNRKHLCYCSSDWRGFCRTFLKHCVLSEAFTVEVMILVTVIPLKDKTFLCVLLQYELIAFSVPLAILYSKDAFGMLM